VSGAGVAPARAEHLDGLRAAYPGLPTEAILKQDVLTEGVSPAPGLDLPEIAVVQGGPFSLRRTIVRLRTVADSPYACRMGSDGLTLADAATHDEIASLRAYPWRPDYDARVLPSGAPAVSAIDPLGNVRLSRVAPPSPADVAEAAAETFVLPGWRTGETPLALRLVLDPAVTQLPEAEQDAFVLPYTQALLRRVGRIRPVILVSPPRTQADEQRLLEAGVTGRISSLEIWDREAFDRVGPRAGISRDQWVERLIGQAHVYTAGLVQPALLIGKETYAGGLEPAAALASSQTAVRFFLQHRVLVRAVHWRPEGVHLLHRGLTVRHYLDLDLFWYHEWRDAYGVEFIGDSAGPGQSRDPDSACWDIGRGARLTQPTGT
jgi:hypothetical protein